jgi:hypothetical protein
MRAVEIRDERGAIKSILQDPNCRDPEVFTLYSKKENPYTTYPFYISSSSSSNGGVCDIGRNGTVEDA